MYSTNFLKVMVNFLKKGILIVAGLVLLGSCTTLNKVFTSKRHKSALKTIEDLNAENQRLKEDTISIGSKFRNKVYQYDSLYAEFKDLNNSSLSTTEQLTKALKNKTDEINSKETLLREREIRLMELQKTINRQDSITQALNNIVKKALLGFKSDELSVEVRNSKVYISMSDKLLFKSGSANVEEKGKEAIKMLSEIINKNEDIDILIEGHTDSIPIKTPIFKDNWDLSVARATSIVRILSDDNGVNSKRLTASGRGEFFPAADNQSPEGRAKNRRTEIILIPKLDELFKIIQNK